MVDEIMVEDVINGGSFTWVVIENLGNQVSGCIRNRDILWEGIGVHTDTFVSSLYIRGFEGRLSDYQCVDDDS